MNSQREAPELGGALQRQVLRLLGFPQAPPTDLDGLRAIYRAWCSRVPFDNTRKMIALRQQSGEGLPGGQARPFFEEWLASGTGGTCWPTSNALFELLWSLGFQTQRVAGCMRDLGVVNHASVKVTIDGRQWLVDSSLLSNVPLPLDQALFIHDDSVFTAEVEYDGMNHVVWSLTPPNTHFLPCRLTVDGVSLSYYLARYEESRVRSPFNQRLYARRNCPGEMVLLVGNTRFSKTEARTETRTLSPDDVCQALQSDIGLSHEVIEAWTRSGSLADSLRPPSGPVPPPVTRKPPSHRQQDGESCLGTSG